MLPSLPTEAGCVMGRFVCLLHACHRVQKAEGKPSDANETLPSIMTISPTQRRGMYAPLYDGIGSSKALKEERRGICALLLPI